MSRRFRFLTDPRIFRFFTEPSITPVQFFVAFVILSVTFAALFVHFESKLDRARESRLRQDLAEARAEVRSRKAPAAKRNGTAQSTPASLKVSSDTETQTPAVHAPDDTVDTMSDATVEVVHTGPLKGLPLDLAKEIHKEYTDASRARAKRYHEWDLRRRDHKERDIALAKRELAHGDAVLADSKKQRENLLAVFALMSPEQLEAAREEALKTQPAEEVDLFFRHVAEFGTAKSADEINQEAQGIEKNRETLAIAKRVLVAEREEIQSEWEELQRTKPLPPNLGLDEFYTEWKKRNRPKPSP